MNKTFVQSCFFCQISVEWKHVPSLFYEFFYTQKRKYVTIFLNKSSLRRFYVI